MRFLVSASDEHLELAADPAHHPELWIRTFSCIKNKVVWDQHDTKHLFHRSPY